LGNSSRLIPFGNINRIIVLDYIKSKEYHTKITKNTFLEALYQIIIKERKIKDMHTYFHIVSLKIELYPVSQGNPSLVLHYFKDLHNPPKLHFRTLPTP